MDDAIAKLHAEAYVMASCPWLEHVSDVMITYVEGTRGCPAMHEQSCSWHHEQLAPFQQKFKLQPTPGADTHGPVHGLARRLQKTLYVVSAFTLEEESALKKLHQ